ncbi:MAG TPA: hypothetical protein VFM73_03290 [Xanthomonadaceae bacterium]|nr:hypothetical protein [Xanthomonadaceae bacterium]
MKTPTKLIVLALAMATAAPVAAQNRLERVAALAERQEDRKEDRQERREARKEQKQERRDDRQDRIQAQTRDTRDQRRDERQHDRREVRRDNRQERREDRREVRQERRHDRHEVRQDRREDRLRARRYQDLYQERMRDQQRRWATYRYHDRFFSTPFSQRYRYNGRYWNTNRYGMEILREAANDGYAEGIRAGRADRYDNWRFDYRDSWAYRNPGYGYNGRYVDPRHYQHYFREGFRRGYEDGYYGRSQYGRHDNGQYFMIAAILAAILGT